MMTFVNEVRLFKVQMALVILEYLNFLCGGSPLSGLRGYFWICSQKSLLADSANKMGFSVSSVQGKHPVPELSL